MSFLNDCGLPLWRPEALTEDDTYDSYDVLRASTAKVELTFGYCFWFDQEMIYDHTDYLVFAKELAEAIELGHRLTEVSSASNYPSCEMTVRYTLDGQQRELTFEQHDDWIPHNVRDFPLDGLGTIAGRVRLVEFDYQSAFVVWIFPERVDEFLTRFPDFKQWTPRNISLLLGDLQN